MPTKGFTDEERGFLWREAGAIITAARKRPEQACVTWNNYLKGVNGGDLSIYDIDEGRLKVLQALHRDLVLGKEIKVDPNILLTRRGEKEPNARASVEEMIDFINSEIVTEIQKARMMEQYGFKLPSPFKEKDIMPIIEAGLDEIQGKGRKK